VDDRRACRRRGVSRSALVERFGRYLAEPPMAYLTGCLYASLLGR
jgi:hypothetical protein